MLQWHRPQNQTWHTWEPQRQTHTEGAGRPSKSPDPALDHHAPVAA